MLESLQLSSLGALHTFISLVALAAGLVSFVRYMAINPKAADGKIYVVTTALTSLTSLGLFRHGGFGPAHGVAIFTLVLLGVAAAGTAQVFGKSSRYVETIAYSATVFFHMIAAVNETSVRLPVGAPLAADANAPILQVMSGLVLVLFLIGVGLQVYRLRNHTMTPAIAA